MCLNLVVVAAVAILKMLTTSRLAEKTKERGQTL